MSAINKEICNICTDIDLREASSSFIANSRKVKGKVGPNKKIKIMWDDGKEDNGYLFIMPGYKESNFWTLVAHIEKPTGSDRPIWCALSRLSSFRKVVSINVFD